MGYLLKDRVSDSAAFLDAIERVGNGGTAFDQEVVRQLLLAGPADSPISRLTDREREVLTLMAQGHTNASLRQELYVTQSAVEKHITSIFTKLDLPQGATCN
ncbi:response regulator transcription factor [Microbacterium sp. 22303]|uniref:response regulator transcription factor n=1 Tax=Microbacterium sp. 22303 TaxID=3453905 RepID=UPI003F826A66